MAKLEGKVAVVTGASSGIGEATAEALAAEGAAVVVAARREDRLTDLVERIRGNGGRVLAAVCDVTDESQAHGLIQKAVEEFGSVDILVNNAGVMLLSSVGKGLSEEWRRMSGLLGRRVLRSPTSDSRRSEKKLVSRGGPDLHPRHRLCQQRLQRVNHQHARAQQHHAPEPQRRQHHGHWHSKESFVGVTEQAA
jgi:hypothetical protein